MGRPRLLVTGFGPFPGAPRNPSGAVAERLAARADLAARFDLVARILPVTWEAVSGFDRLLAAVDPDAVLMLGLARKARVVRVERWAHNRAVVAAVDAEGCRAASPLLEAEAPNRRAVFAPTREMATAIAALGLPVALSDDAGAYLCNALLWSGLRSRPTRPTAFLHLPPTRAVAPGSPWRSVDLERAARASIGALTAGLRRRGP